MKRNIILLISIHFILFILLGLLSGCSLSGGKYQVTSFKPEGSAYREAVIEVRFSLPVMEDTERINVPFTVDSGEETGDGDDEEKTGKKDKAEENPELIAFDPPIIGEYRWIDESTLQLAPFERLTADTEYQAVVAKKIGEKKIGGKRKYSFSTPRFKLEQANMFFDYFIFDVGEKNIIFELSFNYDVNVEDIKRYVKLYRNKEEFPYEVSYGKTGTRFKMVSAGIKRQHQDQTFKLVVSKDLPNGESGTGLESEVTKELNLNKIPDFSFTDHQLMRKGSENIVALRFNKIPGAKHLKNYFVVKEKVKPKKGEKEEDVKDITLDFGAKIDVSQVVLTGKFQFGKTYTVTIKEGLSSIDGSTLKKKSEISFDIAQPPAEVSFLQSGSLLPVKDDVNLLVSSYAVKKLQVTVYRVPVNNIPYLMNDMNYSRFGKLVHHQDVTVDISDKFRTNVTEINLKSFIKKHGKGMYYLLVKGAQGWPRTDKWVLGTDLGLIAKHDYNSIYVFCNSLTTFAPKPGTEVRLLNQTGEPLMTSRTDSNGVALFENYKSFFKNDKPAFMSAKKVQSGGEGENGGSNAAKEEDYAYLSFKDARVNLTGFNITGDPYKPGTLEAFVYPSRDLYKPGEEIFIAAVVNKIGGGDLTNLPVKLKVSNPQSVTVFEQNAALNRVGMCDFGFTFPRSIKTGTYTARLFAGNLRIGQMSFKIEEFIPQTLRVAIDVERESLPADTPLVYQVKGVNLFGTPAADRQVTSTVNFSYLPFKASGYEDFSFTNSRFTFKNQEVKVGSARLDSEGIVKYECLIPSKSVPHGLLNARIYAEVQQKGGRAVAMVKNVPISDKTYFLGVKKAGSHFASLKEPARFEIVALNREGRSVTVENVEVYIVKHGWYNMFQKAKWQKKGKYESDEYQDIILRKYIPLLKGRTVFSFDHENLGDYEIIVIQKEDRISANRLYSVAGDGDVGTELEKAFELKLKLDNNSYDMGDSAKLSINAPFTGLLLVSVEREKVLYRKVVRLDSTSRILDIPVDSSFLPNAYITCMLFRSYNDEDPTLPVKAYGVIPVRINKDSAKLNVALKVPDTIIPNTNVDVTVSVPGAGDDTYVTLSMVEEGVLNITNFHVPLIYDFFMRKRALSVLSYDTFSKVISNMPTVESDVTIGGGAYDTSDKHHNPVNLRKKKTIASWSGVVKLTGGKAVISLPVGNYNGSLRFMAVAASKETYGSAEVDKVIFSPYIIQPTVPITIAPGDKLSIPVSIFNKTGGTSNVDFSVDITGPLKIKGPNKRSFELENDAEKFIDFRIESTGTLGEAEIVFTSGDGSRKITMTERVGIRPASVKETISKNGVVNPGKEQVLVDAKEYHKQTLSGNIFISPFAEAEHLGKLEYLLDYPHGCVEQVISKAFPQLYITGLARYVSPFLYKEREEEQYIKSAINTIELYYSPQGLELWPGYGATVYLSAYAAHFLSEAAKKGYEIKDDVFKGIINGLSSEVRLSLDRRDDENTIFDLCYSLYVLSAAGKNMRESMEFVRDKVLKEDSNILCWLYLAAAYSKIGDKDTAYAILEAHKDLVFPEKFSWWGNPYLSDTASVAMLLLTLLEVNPSHPVVDVYLENLTQKLRYKKLLNTHEASYSFQVFSKLFSVDSVDSVDSINAIDSADASGDAVNRASNNTFNSPSSGALRQVNGTLTAGTKSYDVTGDSFLLQSAELAGKKVVIKNSGEKPFYYSYYTEAYPLRTDYEEPDSQGLSVDSVLYDSTGSVLDQKYVPQGGIVVQKVTVNSKRAGNAVIVILYSGGLELENPRLKKVEGLDWIPDYSYDGSDYIDIREDRILIYTDFNNRSDSRTYYFSYRAVFPGEFIVPYLFAEDMYDPATYGRTASSRIFIVPRD